MVYSLVFFLLAQRRRCGEAARLYLKKRDSQAGILISRISKLLKEYERRLEGMEGFVYMHIVGTQLEKHCSVVRAKSLSGKLLLLGHLTLRM